MSSHTAGPPKSEGRVDGVGVGAVDAAAGAHARAPDAALAGAHAAREAGARRLPAAAAARARAARRAPARRAPPAAAPAAALRPDASHGQ